MKKLLFLALATLSAQTFAQVCEVDMVDTYNNRIVRTFRAYGDPNTCIEGMKECRKSIRLDYSNNPQYPNNRLDCVRAGYNPNPNPYPNPNPNPYPNPNPNPYPNPNPNPYPQYGVTVSGLIEDQPFMFSARDASELYYNCLADIRRVIYGSADEMFFTANNNRFVATQTSGWYNDTQICSILEQEARRTYNAGYTQQIRIVGSLERAPFQIFANDRTSLVTECINAFSATRQGTTDELTYSLNGAPFQQIRTSGWWNSPARACKAMILHLDSMLR